MTRLQFYSSVLLCSVQYLSSDILGSGVMVALHIVALVCSEHWTLTSWVWTWIKSERISERRKNPSAIELLKSKPITIWNGQTLRAAEVQTMLLTHRQRRSLNDQWLHKTHGKDSGQPRRIHKSQERTSQIIWFYWREDLWTLLTDKLKKCVSASVYIIDSFRSHRPQILHDIQIIHQKAQGLNWKFSNWH